MSEKPVVCGEEVEQAIYLIRGRRVMLSTDLARLYAVEPKALIQAVKRNVDRFPADFMFPLVPQEVVRLRSRFVTLDEGGESACPGPGDGAKGLAPSMGQIGGRQSLAAAGSQDEGPGKGRGRN